MLLDPSHEFRVGQRGASRFHPPSPLILLSGGRCVILALARQVPPWQTRDHLHLMHMVGRESCFSYEAYGYVRSSRSYQLRYHPAHSSAGDPESDDVPASLDGDVFTRSCREA